MDSNPWDFLSQNLGLILAILGLLYALIKFFGPRKPQNTPKAHLTQTEIAEADAAGQRARDDVRARFGKHFEGKNT